MYVCIYASIGEGDDVWETENVFECGEGSVGFLIQFIVRIYRG